MKAVKILVLAIALSTTLWSAVWGDSNRFVIGFQYGGFAPADYQISGGYAMYSMSQANGFGNASEYLFYAGYYFSDFELRLESGARIHDKEISDGLYSSLEYYRGQLYVYPIDLGLIYHIQLANSRISPYLGLGGGIYISKWQQEYADYYMNQSVYKGSANPFGTHFILGVDFPVKFNIYISGELRYSYISGDWNLKEVNYGYRNTKIENLNIGGTSLREGIAYRF